MDLAFRSEQGQAQRNEDSLIALPDQGAFVVCDGLSVTKGGDLASRLSCEALKAWLEEAQDILTNARKATSSKEDRRRIEESLTEAFAESSRAIFQKAATDPGLHGMCTGADILLFLGTHALVGHVGAGRVYLVRKGEAHLLTEDHTQLAYMRRIGKLGDASPQQIASYSRRVTKAVGFQEDVKPDLLMVELEPGDRFLLMTDGVWQALGDGTTFSICARSGSPSKILEELHKTVTETGARDNFTTIVVEPKMAPVSVQAGAEQKIKMLGKVPVFEYLSYQDLLKLLSVGDLVKVGSGQLLCKEGDAGAEMMLVLSGGANVTKNGQVIRVLSRGDVFGEMSMIDAAPRSASVIANAPTNLLAFPRDELFALCREDPTLSVKFLWGVTMEMNRRLRMVSNQLVGRPELEGAAIEKSSALPFIRSL